MERRLTRSVEDPIESALEDFTKKFPKPKRPRNDMPNIPNYVDSISDEDLMSLYGEFIAWLAFARSDLAMAEVNEEKSATNLRLTESKVLIEQWGTGAKGDLVTIAKARRDTDPRVMAAHQEHLKTRAYRKLVESVFDRCDRSTQLLSRELSRRISDKPREVRAQRYNT